MINNIDQQNYKPTLPGFKYGEIQHIKKRQLSFITDVNNILCENLKNMSFKVDFFLAQLHKKHALHPNVCSSNKKGI